MKFTRQTGDTHTLLYSFGKQNQGALRAPGKGTLRMYESCAFMVQLFQQQVTSNGCSAEPI
jgi:hypothetical protein